VPGRAAGGGSGNADDGDGIAVQVEWLMALAVCSGEQEEM
jgi:hypothetical protein